MPKARKTIFRRGARAIEYAKGQKSQIGEEHEIASEQ
jgi:hypothetical protein